MTVRTTKEGRVRGRALQRARPGAPPSVTGVPKAVLFVFGLIGLVGSLHVTVMIGVEGLRYSENTREIQRLRSDIGVIDQELASLQAILDHAGDARYREHLARRQGFAFPGEQRLFTLEPETRPPGGAPPGD